MCDLKNREKKYVTNDLEIIDLFKIFFKSKETLWVWQPKKNNTKNKAVHFLRVKKIDLLKKTIELISTSDSIFKFDPKENIFIYSNQKKIAVKIKTYLIKEEFIILSIPEILDTLSTEYYIELSIRDG